MDISKRNYESLVPGDVIIAMKNLDPYIANIHKGTMGVVIKSSEVIYEAFQKTVIEPPLVRWMNMTTYNIFSDDEYQLISPMYNK